MPPVVRRLAPGLALTVSATAVLLGLAPTLASTVPALSPLVLALLVGAAVGSVLGAWSRRDGLVGRPRAAHVVTVITPGTDWVARHVLRSGVVLLGLQLSAADVLGLGWRGLTVVGLTVVTTFAATTAIGRRLGVPHDTTLLVATGFSICGAAAVSAMTGVLGRAGGRRGDRSGDAAAVALALVALYGTAAVVVLPRLADLLGLTGDQAGLWIGASVQEVAQVVAAAGGLAATTALATATVAKLARVVLLAPLVAAVAAHQSRRTAPAARSTNGPAGPAGMGSDGGTRPALVPGFVLGFLGAVLLRSLDVVPDPVLGVAVHVTTALFVAAMFALGLGVDVPRLVRTGGRPLLLGACSAVVVTSTALGAVLLLAP
ncbi:YeiH family protein [Isoptericola croceus]|uniref:YeiH family protein n=1 Tax=Isoptericola croceus TaxID=3031406 RepID=UPI0023F6603A|nr:putative sulfate exporter family transporter [Isoptericola croceus]